MSTTVDTGVLLDVFLEQSSAVPFLPDHLGRRNLWANRGSGLKPLAQLFQGRILDMTLNLHNQIVRQRFSRQGSPGLENPMKVIGDIP